MESKVQCFLLGHDVLVWSSEGVEWLRTEWRIVGGLVGALRQNPRQNTQMGLPLLLLPEEVALLFNKGILEVCEDEPKPMQKVQKVHTEEKMHTLMTRRSEHQILRDSIFSNLWEHGYYLTSGLKYGGDFLVYPDVPTHTHSTYIALVLAWKQTINCLASLGRVATKVKKKILLCSAEESQVHYCILEWTGLT